MKRYLFQQLVPASYTKNELDEATVNKVASLLRKRELKRYIRALRMNEQKRSVTIASAFPLDKKDEEVITDMYPNKKIITQTDPSLLLGLRIQDNDMIYQLNLCDTLNRMSEYIEE